MGAGKGKAKRTHASTLNPTSCKLKMQHWNDFVEAGEVAYVNLARYYLEKDDVNQLSDEDYIKVFTSLLKDAVAVGAIQLPEPYTSEDFEVRVNFSKVFKDSVLLSFPSDGIGQGQRLWEAVARMNERTSLGEAQPVILSIYKALLKLVS